MDKKINKANNDNEKTFTLKEVEQLCEDAYITGFKQWRMIQKDEPTTCFEEWKINNLK